ncbi:hypothetical protein GIB67_024165 [Kingdonia uniflora]|uniref:Ubiquitin-like protease family profile domain-containing protein n=1 Tax=Kingdonia uniflora TaxID=39325 RepID=A0A7J7LZM3_9MAGN|nr:hypothetical protein GIB67_024165 [Kingdonia uniflora]
MKSDKEVIEQVDEENQTQEGGAKKGTSNAKNYTSQCTGVGLNKMFVTLPEEEKGVLHTIYFAPLLLIDPIATMSTLVVKIFDRHLSDMKLQFGGTIIQMKPIHVCKILGLRVSPIASELLFVNPEHITNFRMRRFPKKKNTYGLKEIEDALKQAKLERHHVGVPAVGAPAIGSSSTVTEIRAAVVRCKNGDKKDDEDEKDVEEKVKSVEEEQPQVAKEEEVQETMVAIKVAKTDIIFFNQEKVVGEAYQTKESKEKVEHSKDEEDVDEASQTKESKEEVVEGKNDDDGNLQKKPDLVQDEKNQVDQVWSLRKDKLSPEANKDNRSTYRRIGKETVCLNALYTLYPKQWLDNEVIDVYIKALIQYFDTQHHARPDKEKIALADVFVCQYIGRAFNVWTHNMSSPEGVKLKKKLSLEQITSMQWDHTVSNSIHRGDLKVVHWKLILIPWNINDNHWVLCVVSFKGRKICIYDSLVDAKIANAQKKKKLSSRHQLIKDRLSKILPKILIWRDFADRSSPPTGSEVKNYGLNSKWTTSFGKCPIQPNGYDCGVYMLVFMDNILRGMKFPNLIDCDECRYTISYDILRLGVKP